MIMKIRGIDHHLEGLQALFKRLPESHRIEGDDR